MGTRSSYEYVEGWGMAVGAPSRVLRPSDVEGIRAAYEIARRDGVSLGLRGTGCSYGDASVNEGGHVLDVSRMNRILAFDPETGVAELEAGVSIVSDGEMSKISYSTYVKDRYTGFSGDSPRNAPADLKLFPDFLEKLAKAGGEPAAHSSV